MKVLTRISSALLLEAASLDFFEYSPLTTAELNECSRNWKSLVGRIEASSPIWEGERERERERWGEVGVTK